MMRCWWLDVSSNRPSNASTAEGVLERHWWRAAVGEHYGPVGSQIPDLGVVPIIVMRDDDCVGVVDPTTLEAACKPDAVAFAVGFLSTIANPSMSLHLVDVPQIALFTAAVVVGLPARAGLSEGVLRGRARGQPDS